MFDLKEEALSLAKNMGLSFPFIKGEFICFLKDGQKKIMPIDQFLFTACRQLVRRKAKRLERATDHLVNDLQSSIVATGYLTSRDRTVLMRDVNILKAYLQNDDYKENSFNFDTENPSRKI